jgi:rfaE bifunctional protein nucleotidyltransferase chain/domain
MIFDEKIVSPDALRERLAAVARPLVFTNGVFDILHPGHVDYLARARALGSALLVGLNADASVRLLEKGADRPINPQEDRAVMLAALESVTMVTVFTEQTPLKLLEIVQPDLYVKGGDYDIETLAETELVRTYGGEAFAIPFLEGYSTTAFLKRIRAKTP